jgi:hypothetical protein
MAIAYLPNPVWEWGVYKKLSKGFKCRLNIICLFKYFFTFI